MQILGEKMQNENWADELSERAKAVYGSQNDEKPYTDTNPIAKGWTGGFWWQAFADWCKPEISLQFLRGSKNWSMGTLNFDVIFFSLELGPVDLFFAYRLNIAPPKLYSKGESGK